MKCALGPLLVALAISGCAPAGDTDRSRAKGDGMAGMQGYTLAPEAVAALASAQHLAVETSSGLVTPGHLALGLLANSSGTVGKVARAREVDVIALTAALRALPGGPPRDAQLGDRAPYSDAARRALGRAMDHAATLGHRDLLGADILYGVSADGTDPAARALSGAGLDSSAITAAIRTLSDSTS